MISIHSFAGCVLADIVRRQPSSPERTSFAWQVAVGPKLASVTSVQLEGTTLTVRSADSRWLKEIDRAKTLVLLKVQHLLGADAVTRIRTRL